jgi:hypothetical protein
LAVTTATRVERLADIPTVDKFVTEFGGLIAAEAKKWGILIKAAGIKPV